MWNLIWQFLAFFIIFLSKKKQMSKTYIIIILNFLNFRNKCNGKTDNMEDDSLSDNLENSNNEPSVEDNNDINNLNSSNILNEVIFFKNFLIN